MSMMRMLIHLFVTAGALLVAAYIVPGIKVESFTVAIIAALVLGLLNIFVRPLLVLLTLPATILTLGLFIFVINALMFWLVTVFVDGISVSGFFPALVGSLIISLISAITTKLIEEEPI